MSSSRPSTPPIRPLSANCPRKTVRQGWRELVAGRAARPVRDNDCDFWPGRGTGGTVTSDGEVGQDSVAQETMPLPGIPVSAGALIFDRAGRLLILKPTYKSGWTIPGGVMEADGESPWEACRREVREETGIDVVRGRLAAVDFRRPRPGRPGGIRFLIDCGQVSDKA